MCVITLKKSNKSFNTTWNLAESEKIQGELSEEVEHMKKQLIMLNSGSSKLNQILTSGKATGDHMRLGYKGVFEFEYGVYSSSPCEETRSNSEKD